METIYAVSLKVQWNWKFHVKALYQLSGNITFKLLQS